MTAKLPIRLKKEPLIDAIFELRFSSAVPASDVLPGFLFARCTGSKIERLAASELPKPLRDSDTNLQFAPLTKLTWDRFVILIGDRSLAVGCKVPYPGWSAFQPAIIEIVNLVREIGVIQTVHRFSMKYVDLIPSESLEDQISRINLSMTVGGHSLKKEVFSLRMEIPQDDLINVVQIQAPAVATLQDGETKEGVVVDIDTIAQHDKLDFDGWLKDLPTKLEIIHGVNKSMFFGCLKQTAIDALEPVYE